MLGLLLIASLPIIGMLSSALLVLLILGVGFRRAMLVAAAVAILLAIAATLGGNPPQVVVGSMAMTWLPCILLGVIVLATRSYTLTMQLTVLVLAVFVVVFYVTVSDPAAFWTATLQQVADEWMAQGQEDMATVVLQLLPYAEQFTLLLVVSFWLAHAGFFSLGFALYSSISGEKAGLGRFSDLNYGKILAVATAVLPLVAIPLGSTLLSGLGLLLYVVFWLQGLAVVHNLVRRDKLSKLVLFGVYGSLFFLPFTIVVVLILALFGYADAWFGFRKERTPTAT